MARVGTSMLYTRIIKCIKNRTCQIVLLLKLLLFVYGTCLVILLMFLCVANNISKLLNINYG